MESEVSHPSVPIASPEVASPTAWRRLPFVTLLLVALMIGVTLAGLPWGGPAKAVAWGAKDNPSIRSGQWWRLLSCAFLHVSYLHLAFNVYAMLLIGTVAERAYGNSRYLTIFVASAIGASLLSYRNTDTVTLGASGAIFGVLGAVVASIWRGDMRVAKQVSSPAVAGAAVWVIGSVLNARRLIGFDNGGHLGGIFAGALMSLALAPDVVVSVAVLLALAALSWSGLKMAQSIGATRPRPGTPLQLQKL